MRRSLLASRALLPPLPPLLPLQCAHAQLWPSTQALLVDASYPGV